MGAYSLPAERRFIPHFASIFLQASPISEEEFLVEVFSRDPMQNALLRVSVKRGDANKPAYLRGESFLREQGYFTESQNIYREVVGTVLEALSSPAEGLKVSIEPGEGAGYFAFQEELFAYNFLRGEPRNRLSRQETYVRLLELPPGFI